MTTINRTDVSNVQPNIDFVQEQQGVKQIERQRIEAFDSKESFTTESLPEAVRTGIQEGVGLPQEQQQELELLLANLSSDDQASLDKLGSMLNGIMLSMGDPASAEDIARVRGAMEQIQQVTGAEDSGQLAFSSIMSSYGDIESEMLDFASKVENNNEFKTALREAIAEMQEELLDPEWSGDADDVRTITVEIPVRQDDGSYKMEEVSITGNKEQIQAEMENLEGVKDDISALNEMDMLQLQESLNKKQQYMQMMSNIMKMMHDTAKSIISNLK